MSDQRSHRVVVVGGGFGGLQAVLNLRRAPVEVNGFLAWAAWLSVLGVRSLFALGGSALVAMSLLGARVFHPHDRSATPHAGPEPNGLPAPRIRLPALDASSNTPLQAADTPAALAS